jgi:hypothetical protein
MPCPAFAIVSRTEKTSNQFGPCLFVRAGIVHEGLDVVIAGRETEQGEVEATIESGPVRSRGSLES